MEFQIKKLFFGALFSLITVTGFTQTDVVKSAETYVEAYIDADIETLFFLTHPNIVSMGGGKKYVLDDLKGERGAYDNMNFVFEEGMIGTPSIPVEVNNELQIIVPITYIVRFNEDKYKTTSNLFAGSSDGGETWRFINLDQHDKESLSLFVPNLSEEIEFPSKKDFIKIEK